jgi:hypothetical protein
LYPDEAVPADQGGEPGVGPSLRLAMPSEKAPG